jgi:hypothetical protein
LKLSFIEGNRKVYYSQTGHYGKEPQRKDSVVSVLAVDSFEVFEQRGVKHFFLIDCLLATYSNLVTAKDS